MSLDALLAVRADQHGIAQRTARVCHRVLRPDPMAICLFGLGAEPYAAAALAWGRDERDMRVAVAGDPRERRLLFPALERLAADLLPYVEGPWATATHLPGRRGGRGHYEFAVPLPQFLVPNQETLMLLGRIGRRIRYLPTDGETPASAELVRLGAHLDFLRKHAAMPGQQIVIVASDLVNTHWQTSLNEWERLSLSALDAYVEPPEGVHGYQAAGEADREPLGPRPDARQDARVAPLIRDLNRARAGQVAPGIVGPLLSPFVDHYRPLLGRAYEVTWRCHRREQGWPTARYATSRHAADRDAYSMHMDLVSRNVRRRARMTTVQAIRRIAALEQAQDRLAAQEAVDDPLRMVDAIFGGQASIGSVTVVDATHRPPGTQGRPRIHLATGDEPPFDVGDIVHWDHLPEKDLLVVEVGPGHLLLQLENPQARPLPEVGQTMCVTSLSVEDRHFGGTMPATQPWTHRARDADDGTGAIEDEQAA